jgi:hypothetical protein
VGKPLKALEEVNRTPVEAGLGMAAAPGTLRVLPDLIEDAGPVLCSSFREVARPSSETDGLCRLPGAYLLLPFSALLSALDPSAGRETGLISMCS